MYTGKSKCETQFPSETGSRIYEPPRFMNFPFCGHRMTKAFVVNGHMKSTPPDICLGARNKAEKRESV